MIITPEAAVLAEPNLNFAPRDLGRRFDHARAEHKRARIHDDPRRDRFLYAEIVEQRYPDLGLVAELGADSIMRVRRLGQSVSQQRYAIVFWRGCAPGADVCDPGLPAHPDQAAGRDDGYRVTARGQNEKPRPGWT